MDSALSPPRAPVQSLVRELRSCKLGKEKGRKKERRKEREREGGREEGRKEGRKKMYSSEMREKIKKEDNTEFGKRLALERGQRLREA